MINESAKDFQNIAVKGIASDNDYQNAIEKGLNRFSKIYLEKTENLIVLFDEPELSLSLPWQKRLLPDIMNSEKCKFLLAVTHSPFIFQNKLESHAVGINMYMDDINE